MAYQKKHGIDFVAAQALWSDAGLVILPSKYPDEPRFLAIGRIDRSEIGIRLGKPIRSRLISTVTRALHGQEKLGVGAVGLVAGCRPPVIEQVQGRRE